MEFKSSDGRTLYGGVVILETDAIEDEFDFERMLNALKRAGIKDGREYQISNGYCILMNRDAYDACKHILKRFGVTEDNL